MKNISDLDKNLKVQKTFDKNGMKFYDASKPPFSLYGVIYEDNAYRRIPQAIADTVSKGVTDLNMYTAGGRISFKTDSLCIAFSVKRKHVYSMPHMALTGICGSDLYEREDKKYFYKGTFVPPCDSYVNYESKITFKEKKMRDIIINMPLYAGADEIYIGITDDAKLLEGEKYSNKNKIVYYGSSVTQGGCASKPGMSYEGVISRRFDCDFLNLGFSGNAKGEDNMSEYIKNLSMDMFIYDYDYNAPDKEHLIKTHERMFLKIREAHPFIPIIILSRPKYYIDNTEEERFQVIKKTYDNAIKKGDTNVYLIKGSELMKYAMDDGLVDNCHPTDLGFYSMAKVLGDFIEENKLLK